MPEHCYNSLVVEGKPEDLTSFDQAFKGYETVWPDTFPEDQRKKVQEEIHRDEPEYLLEALFPIPPEVLEKGYSVDSGMTRKEKEEALGDHEKWWDGYSWLLSHWGTSRDIIDFDFADLSSLNEGSIEYVFATAWTPPDVWLLTVSKKFPQLLFKLHSVLNGQLLFECKAGEVLQDRTTN